MSVKRFVVFFVAIGALLVLPRIALAHAHLLSSTPAANASVHGPNVTFDLKYNSRVDLKGSLLTLVRPDGQTQKLALDSNSDETNLDAHATLKPGSYTLRWQALSTDGHITRGEIPFTVQ